MIKLKDFVDVNLKSIRPQSNEANKTVVYIYGNKTSAVDKTLNASDYAVEMTDFDASAQAFITRFFDLGGASLRVICVKTTQADSLDTAVTNNNAFIAQINNLDIDQVAFVLREAQPGNIGTGGNTEYDSSGYHYETFTATSGEVDGFEVLLSAMKTIVDENGTAFRKLLTRGHYPTGSPATYTLSDITNLTRDENLIWKLVSSETDLASVLAYFSKVTLNNPETLSDYSFTEEPKCADMSSTLASDTISWADIKEFVNVVVDLQQNGTKINLGGNTSAGFDMIQEFESIYISQKLVDKELELLRSKINILNATPLIHSTVIDVMETYYNIGYLVQTRYTGPNIYRNVNGKNICVLATNEVITGGYKVVILPKVTNSSVREFPEVELIISTNKGIRFIKTTGVVL